MPDDGDVYVSAHLGPPEIVALWSTYGVALADAAKKRGYDDFSGEVAARTFLADRWKESRAAKRLHDDYLDALAQVRDAGFMAEYVLAFLTRPGWTLSGDDLSKLNIAGFQAWRRDHLAKDHQAATRVKVVLEPPVRPTSVPGAHLRTFGEIDPRRVPCTKLQPLIDAALADWDREAQALTAAPLSIRVRGQILPALDRLARDPRVHRDGVVFASPAAIELLFGAGFCAVDRGAWTDAERLLRRAVSLSPASPDALGELVQTLIMEKKLDDADAALEEAIAVSDSACQSGILWRKRGYILFDRRKMVDAYRAYARSLEYDPENQIARSEMRLIVTALRRTGTYDDKALEQALAPEVTPPIGKLTVTRCPR